MRDDGARRTPGEVDAAEDDWAGTGFTTPDPDEGAEERGACANPEYRRRARYRCGERAWTLR